MKRFLLSLILILVTALLFSQEERVLSDAEMSEEERSWAIERLHRAERDFGAEESVITGYSDEYPAAALSFTFDGNPYTIFYEKGSRSSMNSAIDDALRYAHEKSEEPSIDYIYDGSYSTFSLPDERRGTTWSLRNAEGRAIALFELSGREEEVTLLEPVYISRAYSGMSLRKELGLYMDLVLSSTFYPGFTPSVRFDIRMRSWLYPVNPFIGMLYIYPSGVFGVVGLSYTLRLGSFFRGIEFTLLQDASLTAKAAFICGIFSGFSYGALWSLTYEHSINSTFYWSIGLSPFAITGGTSMSQYPISLALGVRI